MHIHNLLNPNIDTEDNDIDLMSGTTCQTTSPPPTAPKPSIQQIYTDDRFYCTFEGCTKSFTRRYNLLAHYRCHAPIRAFACPDCDLRFARKHDLTRHCKSRHGEKAYGPCGYCGGRFARSDAYKRHLKVEEERRGGGVMVGGLNRIGVDRVGQQRFQYQVNSVNPSSSS